MSSVRFDVPEQFMELLKGFKKEMLPERVIDCLMWASADPQGALQIVKTYEKLRSFGKQEFARYLSWGENPDQAIDLAIKNDAEHREKHSLLSRAIPKAKKGGYTFKMPNGLDGTLVWSDDTYWFLFNIAGEEVRLGCLGRDLWYVLDSLINNRLLSPHQLRAIIFQEKYCFPHSTVGQAVINAVMENVKPSIAVLIN